MRVWWEGFARAHTHPMALQRGRNSLNPCVLQGALDAAHGRRDLPIGLTTAGLTGFAASPPTLVIRAAQRVLQQSRRSKVPVLINLVQKRVAGSAARRSTVGDLKLC